MIWLALLIPVIAVAILGAFFPKRTHIVEYLVIFVVPIICIFVGKYASIHSQTKDAEFWNSYGTQCVYEEEWRERWTETETYTVTVGSGKNARTETRTRTVTKRRTHPEQWTLYDNIGGSTSVSKKFFDDLCALWGNKTFKDMHRGSHTSHTITKDGDAYVTEYDSIFDHTVPICKKHSYENRIQCSKSVFNFREVSDEDKEKYKLFDYPAVNVFGFQTILGSDNSTALLRLQKYNALNGARKQLHMMVLVFNNQPLEAGLFQESYWKGGNKNEFILCVGVDKSNKIKWTKVVSWTDVEELKIRTARHIKEMEDLDLVKVVDYLGENVPKTFVRKSFEDFSYISVRPTTRAIIITYIITLLVALAIGFFAVFNSLGFHGREYQSPSRFHSRHRRWR